MKYWISVAVATGLVLAPIAGEATTKKVHRSHMHRAEQGNTIVRAPSAFYPTGGYRYPSGGYGYPTGAYGAAGGGNNAASMSGSNSAPENANGRSSGGGFGGR